MNNQRSLAIRRHARYLPATRAPQRARSRYRGATINQILCRGEVIPFDAPITPVIEQRDSNLWVATVGEIEVNLGDRPEGAEEKINRRLAELWERYVIHRDRNTATGRRICESLLDLVHIETVE